MNRKLVLTYTTIFLKSWVRNRAIFCSPHWSGESNQPPAEPSGCSCVCEVGMRSGCDPWRCPFHMWHWHRVGTHRRKDDAGEGCMVNVSSFHGRILAFIWIFFLLSLFILSTTLFGNRALGSMKSASKTTHRMIFRRSKIFVWEWWTKDKMQDFRRTFQLLVAQIEYSPAVGNSSPFLTNLPFHDFP